MITLRELTNFLTFHRHGRDHRLRVWQLKEDGFGSLDTRLPVEGKDTETRKEPWLLHSMPVNALNFCAFAMCYDEPQTQESFSHRTHDPPSATQNANHLKDVPSLSLESESIDRPVILAVSNALDSGAIDFFRLPSERRVSTLPVDKQVKTGMVMALSLSTHSSNGRLTVLSGYESGHAMVHVQQSNITQLPWSWEKVLVSLPHSQPLLSLDTSPAADFFFTSSADAIIAKFAVPTNSITSVVVEKPIKILNTRHAGQQGLSMRSDGRIFATAGWDARIRVYSAKAMRELAVLKWHKDGCYAVAFATIDPEKIRQDGTSTGSTIADLGHSHPRSALGDIKDQRDARAQTTHWLAAGGKDGKISLWDIY